MSLKIHKQPHFPRKDISKTTADTLGLMLSNPDTLEGHREKAENMTYLYQIGHIALTLIAQKARIGYLEDFSHGINIYEATSLLTNPNNPVQRLNRDRAEGWVDNFCMELHAHEFFTMMQTGREGILENNPQTSTVIRETGNRWNFNSTYSLAAAGLMLQLELRATSR